MRNTVKSVDLKNVIFWKKTDFGLKKKKITNRKKSLQREIFVNKLFFFSFYWCFP